MTEVYNLDYDEELLAHLPDSEAWVILRSEGFREELIVDEEIRGIYRWQREHIREHSKPATATVLSDEFEIDFRDPETSIGDLIDRMRVRYVENEGREALKALATTYQEDPLKLAKTLGREHKRLGDLLNKRGEIYGTGDANRAMEEYYAQARKGPGPSFGFEALDDLFRGQRGITVLLGPPKSWKSWFGLKGLLSNASEGTYPWLYALELPASETWMRLGCMLGDVPWHKYLHDAISQAEWDKIKGEAEVLDSMGVYKILHPPHGERDIDEMIQQGIDAGAGVIFIDQLQYVEVDGHSLGAWNETGKYWDVMNRARDYSDEIPICFIHQFNRSTINADSMPDVKQAKGSSAIEEAATLCLGVWASKDMRRSNKCELGVLASRNYMELFWEVDIELTNGCNFEIVGRVEHE